jgi:putative ABC transport system permease protein
MIKLWIKALMSARRGRVAGAVAGLALTVGLLGALGAFVVSASDSMARRAIAGIPVDWQVLIAPGADLSAVIKAIDAAAPHTALEVVGYADSAGFEATTGETSQTTGPGIVLGIEPDYRNRFPEQIRLNVGSWDGVLVAGQTAANLHVSPGDIVTIERIGAPAVDIKVAGIVALPNADSLFQAVGVPKGIAPQAPPDNVLIMPVSEWRTTFGPQRAARPDTVRMQVHVRLAHDEIPSEPSAAFVQAGRTANNLEARVAGSAAVANNLAARLDGVRADAIYLRLLFLFLGLPGVMLAILVTLGVATSGSERRRREQALLRIRGASISQILQLAWAEAAVIGAVGVILGLVLAGSAALTWLHLESLRLAAPWFILAAGIGFAVAIAAFLVPAWRDAMTSTVSSARADARQQPIPLWQRTYVDLAFLIAGVAAFWSIASTGYQIVLAPEGVAQTSVHYEALLAPACLWIGAGLFWIRLSRLILGRAQGVIAATITPFARDLGPTVAASLSRQQVRMGRGVALTSLAFAFATATAIFNATYEDQSRVDAELTNGADVTVTGTSSQPAGALLGELTAIPGIAAAKPLMHRFAYVGSDLQDLFGIDPASIGKATTIADAYFANNNAVKALGLLKQNHDGVLMSQETVQDFQLQPGDQLNLRLQSAVDHQYHVVPFHFVGVAREFPTAPKDSFLVANASYIAEQTSSDSHEVVLIRTSRDAESVAAATRELTAAQPGMRVTTLRETQAIISSSLTAIDLRSLTDLELGFAVLMVAGVTGLILGLGLAERRRSFTILSALGARPAQLGAFLWTEGLFVVVGGAVLGVGAGIGIAEALVTILAGVFDPPPDTLSMPWRYLVIVVVCGLVCAAISTLWIQVLSRQADLEALRGG